MDVKVHVDMLLVSDQLQKKSNGQNSLPTTKIRNQTEALLWCGGRSGNLQNSSRGKRVEKKLCALLVLTGTGGNKNKGKSVKTTVTDGKREPEKAGELSEEKLPKRVFSQRS